MYATEICFLIAATISDCCLVDFSLHQNLKQHRVDSFQKSLNIDEVSKLNKIKMTLVKKRGYFLVFLIATSGSPSRLYHKVVVSIFSQKVRVLTACTYRKYTTFALVFKLHKITVIKSRRATFVNFKRL